LPGELENYIAFDPLNSEPSYPLFGIGNGMVDITYITLIHNTNSSAPFFEIYEEGIVLLRWLSVVEYWSVVLFGAVSFHSFSSGFCNVSFVHASVLSDVSFVDFFISNVLKQTNRKWCVNISYQYDSITCEDIHIRYIIILMS
jgi:hypothetical protein